MIDKDTKKLQQILKNAIMDEEPGEEIELYKTILYIADNDYISAMNWLSNNYKPRPLYLALKLLISQKLGRFDIAKSSAQELTFLLPNDILPHILLNDVANYDKDETEYAKETQRYLKNQKFHFADLYYGPFITRYLYVQQNLIAGQLYYLRKQLKDVLETQTGDNKDIVNTLALASFYDKAFEESFTLYNTVIDEFKIRDAYTLFMGAVASTAASHHANAIALLELTKLKDKKFLEARYALGLLYMEVRNNKGSAIQFAFIDKSGFSSEYFNFDIDTDKLLFEKQTNK